MNTCIWRNKKHADFGIIWLVGETQCNVTTIKWLTQQNLSCQAFISHQSQDFRGGGCCHCCHTQLHRGFHFATSWSSCPGAGGKEIGALGKNSKLNWTKKGAKKEWDHRNLEKTLFETLIWMNFVGYSKMGHASSHAPNLPPPVIGRLGTSFGLQDVPSVWTPQSGLGRPLAVHRPPPAMTQFKVSHLAP